LIHLLVEAAGIEPLSGFDATAESETASIEQQNSSAANVLQGSSANGHVLTAAGADWHDDRGIPAAVARIADSWPRLPPDVREAILTLVDATVQP
jgi:hypothetical protein